MSNVEHEDLRNAVLDALDLLNEEDRKNQEAFCEFHDLVEADAEGFDREAEWSACLDSTNERRAIAAIEAMSMVTAVAQKHNIRRYLNCRHCLDFEGAT